MTEPTKPLAPNTTSRWWEYYAVRYAMGVGTGTPLAWMLVSDYVKAFWPQIQVPSPFSSPTATLLWAATGLTFCYIASVPMLTIHTARVCLRLQSWHLRRLTALAAVLGIPSVAICLLPAGLTGPAALAQKSAMVGLWSTVSFQSFVILIVIIWPRDTHRLYDQLEIKRPNHPELVESYRHLREHGNSVLIVLGELLLAFCLYELHPCGSDKSKVLIYLGLLIAFWLAPSGLVWMVGTQLERHMAER